MNVKELKEILEKYPDDMVIWVSDRGYCEGGVRLEKVEEKLAWDAGLDGDDIDDEWVYLREDITSKDLTEKGYFFADNGNVFSKKILYLNDI